MSRLKFSAEQILMISLDKKDNFSGYWVPDQVSFPGNLGACITCFASHATAKCNRLHEILARI